MKRTFFRILSIILFPFSSQRYYRRKVQQLWRPKSRKPDTVRNILRCSADMKNLPKAQGYWRMMQIGNLKLLGAFDRLCRQNNLDYFMIGGAIVGKLRHDGFVPWDDDIDVGMMADQYEKLLNVLQKSLPNKDFFVRANGNFFRIVHAKSKVFLDVLKYGNYYRETSYAKDELDIIKKRKKYVIRLSKTRRVKYDMYFGDPAEEISIRWDRLHQELALKLSVFKQVFNEGKDSDPHGGIIPLCEDCPGHEYYAYDTIFPTRRIEFEGVELSFPNSIEIYAAKCWGDIYDFPSDMYRMHMYSKFSVDRFVKLGKFNEMTDDHVYDLLIGKGKK